MSGTMNQMNTYQPTLGIPFFDESFFENKDIENITSLQRNLYQYYCGFGDFQWEERVNNNNKKKKREKEVKEEGFDDGIIKRGGEHENPSKEREGK